MSSGCSKEGSLDTIDTTDWYEEVDLVDNSLLTKHSKLGYLETEKNYQKSFNLGFKAGSNKGYKEGVDLGKTILQNHIK